MSGFELYDKIDDKVNVCFVTAYEEYSEEIKKRFPHSEKTERFIKKPIGIEELVKKVKSRLNC